MTHQRSATSFLRRWLAFCLAAITAILFSCCLSLLVDAQVTFQRTQTFQLTGGANQAYKSLVLYGDKLFVGTYITGNIHVLNTVGTGCVDCLSSSSIITPPGFGLIYNGLNVGKWGFWGGDQNGKMIRVNLDTAAYDSTFTNSSSVERFEACFAYGANNFVCATYQSNILVPNVYMFSADPFVPVWVHWWTLTQPVSATHHNQFGYFASWTQMGKFDLVNRVDLGRHAANSVALFDRIYGMIVVDETLFVSGRATPYQVVRFNLTKNDPNGGGAIDSSPSSYAWPTGSFFAESLNSAVELGGFVFWTDQSTTSPQVYQYDIPTHTVVASVAGSASEVSYAGMVRNLQSAFACTIQNPVYCSVYSLGVSTTTTTTTTSTTTTTTTTQLPTKAVGEPIWRDPRGAPLVLFVLLLVLLIVGTVVAVLILIKQHEDHLKKINAVRGFHQQDMEAATKHLGGSGHHGGGGASAAGGGGAAGGDSMMMMMMMPSSDSGSGLAADASGATSIGAASAMLSGAAAKGSKRAKPSRLIYDFHHTPPQPSLHGDGGAANARGGGGGMMPNLDIISPVRAPPAASPSRSIGLSFGRNPVVED